MSTGFCSVKYWETKIKKNAFDLLNRVHNEIKVFDFEENYFKLIKKFRHLSLLSICLNFSTCQRSCEKKAGYCKKCSRVKGNCYFDLDKFQDIVACRGSHYKDDYYDYLFLDGKLIDLDVFLNRPAYFDYPNYPLGDKAKCCYFLVLSHAQDLFAYFCSILVSMYLNYAMEHF